MATDSALSWGILVVFTFYGFYRLVRTIIEADEARYKGGDAYDVWRC